MTPIPTIPRLAAGPQVRLPPARAHRARARGCTACFLLLLCAGCRGRGPAPSTQPFTRAPLPAGVASGDASWALPATPAQAGRLYHVASQTAAPIPMGDYCYADDEAGWRYIGAQSALTAATNRLRAAVRDRFGSAGVVDAGLAVTPRAEAEQAMLRDGDEVLRDLDRWVVEIRGDQATLRDPAAGPDAVIHARRFGGRWKVNFTETSGGVETRGTLPGHQEPAATLYRLRLQAEDADTLAAEVAAGTIPTAAAVRAERERMRAEGEGELWRFRLGATPAPGPVRR